MIAYLLTANEKSHPFPPYRTTSLLCAKAALLLAIFPFASPRPCRAAEALRTLATGLPPEATTPLRPGSFVPVEAQRLAKAQILWVNWDLLAEMGVTIPPGGLTPEFAKEILDTMAYAVPRATDSAAAFDSSQKKIFYADIYGGNGMGYAQGSGRAAAAGKFQIKGIGITPLVDTSKDEPNVGESLYKRIFRFVSTFTHSHGGASLSEAVREAIWGEILHRELPKGAGRIAFVLSTGTQTAYWGVASEPRALIVRQNSVRPGHFMANWHRGYENAEAEAARVTDLFPGLVEAMPAPADKRLKKGTPKYLARQLEDAAENIARKFAAEYSRGIFHGATSSSNIEIDGRAIDFGPMTTVHGFPKALFADPEPAGDTKALEVNVLEDFIKDVRNHAPEGWAAELPTMSQMRKIAREAYQNQLNRDFLWLAGTPQELSEKVAASEAGINLSRLLQKAARAGNEAPVDTRWSVPEFTGKYELHAILQVLSFAERSQDIAKTINELGATIPDRALRMDIVKAYEAYVAQTNRFGTAQGVSAENLAKLRQLAIERRGRPLPDLYRDVRKAVADRAIMQVRGEKYAEENIGTWIDEAVSKAAKTDLCGPFCVDIEERRHGESGTTLRRYFDARTGETLVQMTLRVQDGVVNAMGALLSPEEAAAVALRGREADSQRPLKSEANEKSVTLTYKDVTFDKLQRLEFNNGNSRDLSTFGTGQLQLAGAPRGGIIGTCSRLVRTLMSPWF